MSSYTNDPRVVLHEDGNAALPDPGGYDGPPSGAWLVEAVPGGGYTLRNDEVGGQGYVTDEGDKYNTRPKVFDSANDAIGYVIGDPEPTPQSTVDTAAMVDDDTDGV